MDQAVDNKLLSWNSLIYLLPLTLLIWAISDFSNAIIRPDKVPYVLQVSAVNILKLAAVFYGLYLLPGWLLLRSQKRFYERPWLGEMVLLSFAIGCTAHVLGCFFQKYLRLPYSPATVLTSLSVGYILVALGISQLRSLNSPPPTSRPSFWPRFWNVLILSLGLFLAWEMTLRGRGSSVSLMGDGFPHLVNTLGTLEDGPFPDALPFFSTFVPNIHPMGFHAMLATLKTLTPGILHIDLIRYFSVLMAPVFVFSLWGFFSHLAQNRTAGALATLAALFVSGGGLSLRVPVVFFPWYWALAWCLGGAVFFLLLKNEWRNPSLSAAAGLLCGVGALMHPFFALRMLFILSFFFLFEILRLRMVRGSFKKLFLSWLSFGVVAAATVGIWFIPLLLRYGFEDTYSMDFIRQNFSAVAPQAVQYVEGMLPRPFSAKEIFFATRENAGWAVMILGTAGLVLAGFQFRKMPAALLLAWFLAMGMILFTGLMPNTYRYFEFFFFSLVGLSAFAMGWFLRRAPSAWVSPLLVILLCMNFLAIRTEFFSKYRYTLRLYGRTSLTETDVRRAEYWADAYFAAKKSGDLDRKFGSYRGYLWSRQKKIWDIFIRNITGKNKGS